LNDRSIAPDTKLCTSRAKGTPSCFHFPARTLQRCNRHGVRSLTDTARLGRKLRGASDLSEVNIRVVGALEPVEAPVAAGLEGGGEAVARRLGGDTAVLLAPAGGGSAKLAGAGVEDANAAAGHGNIEVVVAEIAASVGGLDDHGLALDRAGLEGKPVGRWLVFLSGFQGFLEQTYL